jgi:hypothetical protein
LLKRSHQLEKKREVSVILMSVTEARYGWEDEFALEA